jgi:DNA-binding CsgD family transcriptional regulator
MGSPGTGHCHICGIVIRRTDEGASIVKKATRSIGAISEPRCVRAHAPVARNPSRSLQDAMPSSDPVFLILTAALNVVPSSCWTFARVTPKGDLASLYGSHREGRGLAGLAEELKCQRATSPEGPRIAATIGTLEEFDSGITLVFADDRAHFGILTLLRSAELGPFTSIEISMLTFALDAISDRLLTLRLHHSPQAPEQRSSMPAFSKDVVTDAFYVLDTDLEIIMAPTANDKRWPATSGLERLMPQRLPVILEETVRQLTCGWSMELQNEPCVAHLSPFLVVHAQPMSGPTGLLIGVRIERALPANSLTTPATRFHISPREVQVLALLLDGDHLDQVATHLNITSSTVQDHIKSMLDKTGSRNRSELIARVLGWESAPDSGEAYCVVAS